MTGHDNTLTMQPLQQAAGADHVVLNEPMLDSPVLLVLPPHSTMSRIARLAARGLASLHGWSVDQLDDIALAVSEVLLSLIEHSDGSTIELEFEATPDRFALTGRTCVSTFDVDDPGLRVGSVVLDDVCSHHRVDHHGGVGRITAVITRRIDMQG